MGKSFLLGIGCAVLAGFGYYAFVWPTPTPSVTVGMENAAQTLVGPGIVDARRQVAVSSRLAGQLKTLTVERNDTVSDGDLIATLDDREIALGVTAAEARLRAAAAVRDRASSERERARTILDQVDIDISRKTQLLAEKVIAQAVFDQAKNAFDVATIAALQAEAGLAEAEAAVEAARAALAAAQVQLADTRILAPLSGVVTARSMTPGDMLSPGVPLVRIVDPESIFVLARFDESTIALIRPGQSAEVGFGTAGGPPILGTVDLVGRQVDPETREYIVDIRLDHLPDNWAIGRRVTVQIQAPDPEKTLLVPQTMLARRDGKVGLWVAVDGHARWIGVKLGYLSADRVEILAGLEPGDLVLAPEGMFPWRSVNPVPATDEDQARQ